MAQRGRPRKIPVILEEEIATIPVRAKTSIAHLSVDYSNEGLNNIARKINELIEHINAKVS